MSRSAFLALCAVSLLVIAATANAQVHRCGGSRLYTDKPCENAKPVDLRPNILDAGTRVIPPDPPPAPAVIPPSANNPAVHEIQTETGNVFDRRDASDGEFRSRTAPRTFQ